jgi:putative membrane protein
MLHRRAVPPLLATGALVFAFTAPSAIAATKHPTTPRQDPPRVSAFDSQWLMSSIQGNRFEIAGAKLALTKTPNAAVTTLANRLMRDGTTSLSRSVALAGRLGISVPATPSPTQQWALTVVATFTGAPFDHWYSSLEVAANQQAITEATTQVTDGTNASVRAFARTQLPVLRLHLRLANAALAASPTT